MSNLADRVIAATTPSGNKIELDDVGFPLPVPKDKQSWAEYLTARIIYLNPHLYVHYDKIWLNNEMLTEVPETYYRLAKYVEQITPMQNTYIWRRLKEVLPKLDTNKIAVAPGLLFDMRTGEFFEEDALLTAPWEEGE